MNQRWLFIKVFFVALFWSKGRSWSQIANDQRQLEAERQGKGER